MEGEAKDSDGRGRNVATGGGGVVEGELTGGLSALQRFTADLVPHRVDLH